MSINKWELMAKMLKINYEIKLTKIIYYKNTFDGDIPQVVSKSIHMNIKETNTK